MGRRTQAITVTEPERVFLNTLARSRTEPFHWVQRAKLILKAAEGEQNRRIGAELGLHPRHVKTWRVRWHDACERLRALKSQADLEQAIRTVLSDRPRPGCPPTFSAEPMGRIMDPHRSRFHPAPRDHPDPGPRRHLDLRLRSTQHA